MSIGRRSGLGVALGIATGSLSWALLTAAGLLAVIAAYSLALIIIKTAGGCYLLWLAYKSFKSTMAAGDVSFGDTSQASASFGQLFVRGYAIQMSNPKAALAWIAIVSLGLQPGAPLWVAAVIVVGTAVLLVVIHSLYAVASSAPLMLRAHGRARRWIQATRGAFFALVGLKSADEPILIEFALP